MSADDKKVVGRDFELARVTFFEISSKMLPDESSSSRKTKKSTTAVADEKSPIKVELGVKRGTEEVGCRMTVEFSDGRLSARIDCAAFFRRLKTEADLPFDSDQTRSLAEESVVILAPYVRESLSEITRRVGGKPVLLGSVHASDLAPEADLT